MARSKNRSVQTYSAAVIGVGRAGTGSSAKGGGHRIGYTHAVMFQRNPRTKLDAAADVNSENLEAFQAKFDVPSGFRNYKHMLREVRPDIVTIGTYVGLHCEMIEAAARAGVKGILCEKPFLASPKECDRVRGIAQKTGVKIAVPHIRRYFPAFARAKKLYLDGTVGEPVMCIAGIEGWDLSEWGSHWLDMFRFFHDDRAIKWVFGQVKTGNFHGYGHAMEEHAIAYFEFEGGGKGFLDGGRGMNGSNTMTLVGSDGTIRILREDTLIIDNAAGRRTESFAGETRSEFIYTWDCLLNDLIAWIEGGPEPMLGLTNMLKTSELNLAAYLSAIRGDRVDLPLKDKLDEWPVEVLVRLRKKRAST
ncbi:MAG: Gfo/Idh/MocA family oxidoreductase [Candidatus Hydrogenedentes bacterium]|nr:Gfo/Idh/MocA family oxidoreductase [Candidatus Hydrogenedentota bacterium]